MLTERELKRLRRTTSHSGSVRWIFSILSLVFLLACAGKLYAVARICSANSLTWPYVADLAIHGFEPGKLYFSFEIMTVSCMHDAALYLVMSFFNVVMGFSLLAVTKRYSMLLRYVEKYGPDIDDDPPSDALR